jgi:pyruvate formate lyase activating enzyme
MEPIQSDGRHGAALWKPADGGAVDCFLCEHRCHIAVGNRGICRVRQNAAGELVTRVYGRLIAQHVDPIEKKPLFHFLPGSESYSVAAVGCNFQCGFCQNWQISQAPRAAAGEMPGDPARPETIVDAAQRHRCASISYTYTEPTIFYEMARDIGRLARRRGLKNIFVTNGFMTPEAILEMAEWLDAANVDLKSWQDSFYRQVCKGRLEPVKASIRLLHERGVHVEVTTLLVTGRNDSAEDLKGIAGFLADISADLVWHVSRYHPDFEMTEPPATPLEKVEEAVAIGRAAGLQYVYAGNVAGSQNTVCPLCGAVVVERVGLSARVVNLRGAACGGCGAALPFILSSDASGR